MQQMIDSGVAQSALEDCTLKHYFTPKDEKYGCSTYAREIFLPKGSFVIGKIHRHPHLNFISKGRVKVFTEFGDKYLVAPCTFISEVGLKEVISPTYDDMGLIASTNTPLKLAEQGEKP
jgi:hypothetical protein